MTHTQALLLMIVGTAMWSIGGVVSRFFESAEGFEVTFWRSVFAALTVAVWLAARRGRRARSGDIAHQPGALQH